MVWFTTVGTVRARRFLAERPDAVSICHNNAMIGDIYVNHGVVGAAMRARGNGLWRMVRNPTHIFTYVRDSIRYRSGHPPRGRRAVAVRGRHAAPGLRPGAVADRRHPQRRRPRTVPPADRRERGEAPARDFHLDDDAARRALHRSRVRAQGPRSTIEALVHAPTVLLLVVGGNAQAIEAARARADALGVAERVLFVGTRTDLPLFFAAADMFVLASAYEANALVVLEALASGPACRRHRRRLRTRDHRRRRERVPRRP